MSDSPYNNNPNDLCLYCSHMYSFHFSDDIHGIGSKDLGDTHSGCGFVNSDGSSCICPGFRSSIVRSYE